MFYLHQNAGAAAIREDVESGNNTLVYRYYCSGSEVSLQSCSNNTHHTNDYDNYADSWYYHPRAAVECQQDGINNTSKNNFYHESNAWLLFIILSVTCTMEGATRLAGGSTAREGRVEVCRDGYWGTVCSDSWTEKDAYVVCRQTEGNRISRYK